jgi:hypothetical protein
VVVVVSVVMAVAVMVKNQVLMVLLIPAVAVEGLAV